MTKRHAVSRRSKDSQHTAKAAVLLCSLGVHSVAGSDSPEFVRAGHTDAKNNVEAAENNERRVHFFKREAKLLAVTRAAARQIYTEPFESGKASGNQLYDLLVQHCEQYKQLPPEWTRKDSASAKRIFLWSRNLPGAEQVHDLLFHVQQLGFVGPTLRTFFGDIKKEPLVKFWTDSLDKKISLDSLGQKPFDFWESSVFRPVKLHCNAIFVNMEKEITNILNKKLATNEMLDAFRRVAIMKAVTTTGAFCTDGREQLLKAAYEEFPAHFT